MSLSDKKIKMYSGTHFREFVYPEDEVKKAIKRLRDRNEEIKNPKICPICKKKLSIIDVRGGYCEKHYWIVPSYDEWVDGFEKELYEIFGKEFAKSQPKGCKQKSEVKK